MKNTIKAMFLGLLVLTTFATPSIAVEPAPAYEIQFSIDGSTAPLVAPTPPSAEGDDEPAVDTGGGQVGTNGYVWETRDDW